MDYWVYIMASRTRVLYIGVTSDLAKRVAQHRLGVRKGFSVRYRIQRLVWCERTGSIRDAIDREKQLKRWNRGKKIALIESVNPAWDDLCG
jgi:predicted GIY-YIG superfamily endonuclease